MLQAEFFDKRLKAFDDRLVLGIEPAEQRFKLVRVELLVEPKLSLAHVSYERYNAVVDRLQLEEIILCVLTL